MKIPSTDFLATKNIIEKVNTWSQDNDSWTKRHALTRLVCLVVIPILAPVESMAHAITAVVKLPVAIVKGTVGKINFPKIGKLDDKLPEEYGAKAVLTHAYKTALFAVDALISPIIGLVNPRWDVALHAKMGIIQPRVAIATEEADKAIAPALPTVEDLENDDAEELFNSAVPSFTTEEGQAEEEETIAYNVHELMKDDDSVEEPASSAFSEKIAEAEEEVVDFAEEPAEVNTNEESQEEGKGYLESAKDVLLAGWAHFVQKPIEILRKSN